MGACRVLVPRGVAVTRVLAPVFPGVLEYGFRTVPVPRPRRAVEGVLGVSAVLVSFPWSLDMVLQCPDGGLQAVNSLFVACGALLVLVLVQRCVALVVLVLLVLECVFLRCCVVRLRREVSTVSTCAAVRTGNLRQACTGTYRALCVRIELPELTFCCYLVFAIDG